MKIAVASVGEGEESKVSGVFGRAPYFLIFEDGKMIKAIKNPFAVGGGGAGNGSAYMLAKEGVEIVICSKIGDKAQSALEEEKIKYSGVGEISVREAVDGLKS